MEPNSRHVFAGYAVFISDLAGAFGNIRRADERFPRALQEAERDHSEIGYSCEPRCGAQHVGNSVIHVPDGSIAHRHVAVFGQLSVEAICSTTRQRTTLVP